MIAYLRAHRSSGQATVEYIFILAFAIIFGFKVTNLFTDFFRDSMGGIGHVLSTHLTVGVCPTRCFYANYDNGFEN